MGFEDILKSIEDIKISKEEEASTPHTPTKNLEKFYNHEYKTKLNKYLKTNKIDTILIEYITLDYLVSDLHHSYTTIIDTHDLMSSRTDSYKKYDSLPSIVLHSLEDEIEILSKYHYILSIQQNEYTLLNTKIQKEKNLLVPHAVDFKKLYTTKNEVQNITFVSGPANAPHIVWFIENIWKYFDQTNLSLNIYGNVCNKLQKYKEKANIKLFGFSEELDTLYKDADLVINPVLYGSGLKIKNIEALSYGIPLLTTNEGMQGIEEGQNSAFIVANSVDEWINSILNLTFSTQLRENLSLNAIQYIQNYFSDTKCYEKLVAIINKEKEEI